MITGDGNDNALKIYAAPAKDESFQYIIEPIIKWAGGKRQIINKLLYYMPSKWNTYFEPFLGGGALVSEIYRMNKLKSAVLSDKNFDVYNLFSEIRNNPEELINGLNNLDYRNLRRAIMRQEENLTLYAEHRTCAGPLFSFISTGTHSMASIG